MARVAKRSELLRALRQDDGQIKVSLETRRSGLLAGRSAC
jgi:hypothetical protein